MLLSDFCTQYVLSTSVFNKPTTNSFICMCSLHFIQTGDLGTIGFLLGEVAEMKDTVERCRSVTSVKHFGLCNDPLYVCTCKTPSIFLVECKDPRISLYIEYTHNYNTVSVIMQEENYEMNKTRMKVPDQK